MTDPYRETDWKLRAQELSAENEALRNRIKEIESGDLGDLEEEEDDDDLEDDEDEEDEDYGDYPRGPETQCPRCGVLACTHLWCDIVGGPVTRAKFDGIYLNQKCTHCGAEWRRRPMKDE